MNDQIKGRNLIIGAALLALFLGALDTLVMSAAMPTIVADLGGLHLYSWAFSVSLLCRAVSLPIFGKLADLFSTKALFLISIVIFLFSSTFAGVSTTMIQLILARALQGLGAGGIFALVYIVLSDISTPKRRGKMMSLASFVWGVASILGPSIGGFIVNYISWRWVFFMNIPLGGLSFLGIYLYFKETREKRKKVSVDILGLLTLSVSILSLLMAFLLAGEGYSWLSHEIMGLLLLTIAVGVAFYYVEKHAEEPVIPIGFFSVQGFRIGNGAVFFCSFAIFSLVAYSPLFIQGALGKTPVELGLAMISISLAWSAGSLLCGQTVHRVGQKPSALIGAFFLLVGCGMTLFFSSSTTFMTCFIALGLAGLGMGYVSIATLLTVQNSLAPKDLGIATASNQFSRTLAGTIGVGISGSLASSRIAKGMEAIVATNKNPDISTELIDQISQNIEMLFSPEVQSSLPSALLTSLHKLVGEGVMVVFLISMAMAVVCAVFCFMLPKTSNPASSDNG